MVKFGKETLTPAMQAAFKSLKLERAPGEEIGLHLLRHNWITYVLKSGHPSADVMWWAGHRHLTTTESYLHVRQRIDPADVAKFRRALMI